MHEGEKKYARPVNVIEYESKDASGYPASNRETDFGDRTPMRVCIPRLKKKEKGDD